MIVKKFLTVILIAIFIFLVNISFVGCSIIDCKPEGKQWYNCSSLPSIDSPYNAIYDGMYSITINKKGRTEFTTLDGEILVGSLKTVCKEGLFKRKERYLLLNESYASVNCYQKQDERFLIFSYKGVKYMFSGERQHTKDEFEAYRLQFVDFLTNVYNTGIFPTLEEIKNNDLYKQFTDLVQIDPAHNGPYRYSTLTKIIIEKVERETIVVTTNPDGTPALYWEETTISVNMNGENFTFVTRDELPVTAIKNNEIKQLEMKDIKEGECLANVYDYRQGSGIQYSITSIFYIENSN